MTRRASGLRRSVEPPGPVGMDRYVTQREAAELSRCSKDTVVRARQAGRFPHARLDLRTWTIPILDLVAAGLYHPALGASPAASSGGEAPPAVPGAAPTGMELFRAQARIAALEDLVARQDAELAFLRQLATDTLAKRAS
ncbi:MAG: hypothetical protein ACREPA_12120 [Candidatus Dormibacteraceae bacterium]